MRGHIHFPDQSSSQHFRGAGESLCDVYTPDRAQEPLAVCADGKSMTPQGGGQFLSAF